MTITSEGVGDSNKTEPCEDNLTCATDLLKNFDAFEGEQAFRSGDYVTAINRLSAPAEHGDAAAQLILATIYNNGAGVVPSDPQRSLHWYLLAAQNGNAEAEYEMSRRTQNKNDQLLWLIKAANQDYGPAIDGLALAEELGAFGAPDYVSAARRWKFMAERGDGAAQERLSGLYQRGLGVQRDDIQALMWMDIAAHYPLERMIFEDDFNNPKILRDRLAVKMRPEDVDRADKMALEFLNAHKR